MNVSFRNNTRAVILSSLASFAVGAQAFGSTPEAPVLTAVDNQPVQTVPTQPTPPASGGVVPLSWDDPAFASVKTSSPVSPGTVSNLSITDQSGDPSVMCGSSCNVDHVRITTREGIRCNSGSINLTWMWVDTKGQGADHADGLQCYNPNGSGVVTVKNSTFHGYVGATHTGYFSADSWKGSHVFENVLFWGGDFGLRLNVDGGSSVKLKNVYFVKDSFGAGGAYLIDIPIQQWENVYWVTIQNGKMVIGDAIPQPR